MQCRNQDNFDNLIRRFIASSKEWRLQFVSVFKILDGYKRGQRSKVVFSQAMLDRVAETAAEQAETLQLDERREALAGCVEKLGRRQRDLLAQRFADGASTRSTSERVGRSVESV